MATDRILVSMATDGLEMVSPSLRRLARDMALVAGGLMLEHRIRYGRWWDRGKVCHGKACASLLIGAGFLHLLGRLTETKPPCSRCEGKIYVSAISGMRRCEVCGFTA